MLSPMHDKVACIEQTGNFKGWRRPLLTAARSVLPMRLREWRGESKRPPRFPGAALKLFSLVAGLAAARLGHGQQAFALGALAGQLAGATDGFGLLTGALFRRLFVVHVALHFTEAAFALHLLLQGLERLIDVVVADKNLNQGYLSF